MTDNAVDTEPGAIAVLRVLHRMFRPSTYGAIRGKQLLRPWPSFWLEHRHFGKDAEIQAMDGNQPIERVFNSTNLPSCFHAFGDKVYLFWPQVCHPWTLDSGISAGMTGLQHLWIRTRSGTCEQENKINYS